MISLVLLACSGQTTAQKSPDDTAALDFGCNGQIELCAQALNTVAFVGTHNSMSNAEDAWLAPNQGWNIRHQLEAGVRALNLDTYDIDGTVMLCHGYCELGEQPLTEALSDIRSFLEEYPQNVILITFQDAASAELTLAAFETADLKSELHHQPLGEDWPNLQELIDTQNRLVVFAAQYGSSEHHGYHAQWDYWIDTPYQAQETSDFSCEADRGNIETASLFNINHFITNPIALPEHAEVANTTAELNAHIARCLSEQSLSLTQILIDFVDIGDGIDVIEDHNRFNYGP